MQHRAELSPSRGASCAARTGAALPSATAVAVQLQFRAEIIGSEAPYAESCGCAGAPVGHSCVTDAVGNEGDPTLAVGHAATAALQDTKRLSVTMGVQSRGLRWGRAAALLGTGRALLQQCPPPQPSAETVTCGAKKTPCSPPHIPTLLATALQLPAPPQCHMGAAVECSPLDNSNCCCAELSCTSLIWGCCFLTSLLLHFLFLHVPPCTRSLLSADALWKAEEMGEWGLFLEAAKGIQPKANAITSGCKQASERRELSFK